MDTKEFNSILKIKMLVVYKYLLKNGCSHNDAEDIVQDTFIKAIQYIDGINLNKLNSWLFKVALNEFYDLCRKRSKYPQFNLDNDTFLNNISSEFSCEDYVLNMEKKKNISRVLNGLTPSHKNLLVLKYEMDLTYKEIGEILGISENNVKTYLYRARNNFKKVWEEL